MKQIPLTQGQFTLVDDEDFEYLNQFKWHALKAKNTYYATRKIKRKIIWMHREILKLTDIKIMADHKDGNGLNNQKSNIRPCDFYQNNKNQKPRKGTSKYKGVSWRKSRNKWVIHITINGKQKHVGSFSNEIEAAKAYDEMAKLHYGEFAYLNFKQNEKQ